LLCVERNTLAVGGATAMRVTTVIMPRWARIGLRVMSLTESIASVLVTATIAVLVAVTTARPVGTGLMSDGIGTGITAAVAAVTILVAVTVMIMIAAVRSRIAAVGSRAIRYSIVRTTALARALNARIVDKMNIL
jgi:hypothetical protein